MQQIALEQQEIKAAKKSALNNSNAIELKDKEIGQLKITASEREDAFQRDYQSMKQKYLTELQEAYTTVEESELNLAEQESRIIILQKRLSTVTEEKSSVEKECAELLSEIDTVRATASQKYQIFTATEREMNENLHKLLQKKSEEVKELSDRLLHMELLLNTKMEHNDVSNIRCFIFVLFINNVGFLLIDL